MSCSRSVKRLTIIKTSAQCRDGDLRAGRSMASSGIQAGEMPDGVRERLPRQRRESSGTVTRPSEEPGGDMLGGVGEQEDSVDQRTAGFEKPKDGETG
ncbi:hypothetical protein MMC07_002159 [Pseudocyphellaria aurata]|nr:hypothetical protein [Pseudocyphellaria aurata]